MVCSREPNSRTGAIIEKNYEYGNIFSLAGKATGQTSVWFGDESLQASGRVRYDHLVDALSLWSNGLSRMTVDNQGNVGTGTANPGYTLDVIGTIRAREIKVDLNGADFVFDENYILKPLEEVENFVKENRHLPDIEPAVKMETEGADLGMLNTKLLQKVEELTLYVIGINKEMSSLKNENIELKKRIDAIENAE